MIPQGFAAPNALENISLNQANKYVSKAAKLGVVVGQLYVNPTGGPQSALTPIMIKQAIALGVTMDDPINLVDHLGNNIALADALLKPATVDNIMLWFKETIQSPPLPNNSTAYLNKTLTALANLSTVQLAIAQVIGD